MFDDPIVNEVWRIRQELAGRFDHDVDAILADLMAHQRDICAGHPMVRHVKDSPAASGQQRASTVYPHPAEPAQVREKK